MYLSLAGQAPGWEDWNREDSKFDGGIEDVRNSTMARHGMSGRAALLLMGCVLVLTLTAVDGSPR